MTAYESFAQELLYGGAAGGGKSHWERVMSISLCLDIPGLQYFLFRRSYSDLQKSYVEGPTGYNAILGELIFNGAVESVAKEIRFPNGSKIYLCHCFTGDTLVATSNGPRAIKELVNESGYVNIAQGISTQFVSVRKTRENAEIVRITFDDGSAVRCTPDHKFITSNGPVEAQNLEGKLCQTNELKLSAIKFKSSTGRNTSSARNTLDTVIQDYIALCGSSITVKFQKAMRFTTKIITELIIKSKTLKLCLAQNIANCMLTLPRHLLRQQRIYATDAMPLPSGTLLQQGISGIKSNIRESKTKFLESVEKTVFSVWSNMNQSGQTESIAVSAVVPHTIEHKVGMRLRRTALFVKRLSQAIDSLKKKLVAQNVGMRSKHKKCVSVSPAGCEDVYCLTVPEHGFFALANGVLVSNCQHEKNVLDFGSFEFHVLNIAEAGQFTPFMINYLRSRVRMGEDFKKKIPKHYIIPREYWRDQTKPEYTLPRAIYTCNPIGPGKDYLKKNFVDGHLPDEVWRARDEDGGMLRQFIPAKLGDNPSLDPIAYSASLKGIGNEAYVQALLDGNWRTTIGAFFPQIDVSRHLIRPFIIPNHWPKLMVYDHGSCGEGDPFSIGWYAIADGTTPVISAYTKEPMLCQRDSLICYRRWNGDGLPKTNVVEIANGIKERESEEVLFRIAGGDIIEQRGMVMSEDLKAKGESVFTLFRKHGIAFVMADRRRQNGWAQVDYRLAGENGYPLSFWFDNCYEDLETMSNLQRDPMNPGDILPRQNDHDADRHRYAVMTRPIARDEETVEQADYEHPMRRATPKKLIDMIKKPKKSAYVTRR